MGQLRTANKRHKRAALRRQSGDATTRFDAEVPAPPASTVGLETSARV